MTPVCYLRKFLLNSKLPCLLFIVQLLIRVFMAAYFDERHSKNFPTPEEKCGNLLSCDRIKLFVDGALGIHTAALSLPYTNDNSNYGWLKYSQVPKVHFSVKLKD